MTASTSTASVAVDARVSIDGDRFCFARFIDNSTVERVQNHKNAICGKAHPPDNRVSTGRQIVEFSLEMDITADILDTLLPHMTTTNTSGTIWDASETLSDFPVVVDKVAAIHRYNETRIIRWAIRAQRGSRPVSIQLDCVGKDEEELGSHTFTDGPIGSIYTFPDTGFTYDSTAYPIDRIAIVSDMNAFRQWNNSTTLTDAILTLQNTFLATSTPYVSSTKDIYWNNKTDITNRVVQATFTSGSDVLEFNMPAAKLMAPKSPDIPSKLVELRLPVTFQAHVKTSTDPDTNAFNFDHTNA